MRTGTLRTDEGTKLTYVANVAVQVAKYAQELVELESLRQQLAEIRNGSFQTNGQTYLPAIESGITTRRR